ncbi:phosphatase PAP2 family protein [Nonomuraea sp. NPDC050404]|uniref:phosphatase PAP2 family protein n=1 Tax=Nonomuraea sp. NPDC050404 TaxID=3155783 RepID=UPI0033EDD969
MYQDIVDFALSTPAWLHTFAEVGTDAGLFVFAALFVVAALRAWRAPARDLALVIAGPAGIVLTYVFSEIVKLLVQEDRPCRGGVTTIAACPPLADWSFPSNHSVIAAGAAATLVLVWRSLAWVVFPLAALMAFSRVFVGVHYPHDVAVGFALGATLAPLLALLMVGAVTPAVRLVRARLTGAVHAADPVVRVPSAPRPAPVPQMAQPYGMEPYGMEPYGVELPQRSVASTSRSRTPGSE